MAENMCRTSEVTEIVPPGIGAVVLKELPAAGKQGIVYVIEGNPITAYTWNGTQFVSLSGDCGCQLYPRGQNRPDVGEEGVYYIVQRWVRTGDTVYDLGWGVSKWENNHYVDVTYGYEVKSVDGSGTGNAVWDIAATGYTFNDVKHFISQDYGTARIIVRLGGQSLTGYLQWKDTNTLTCSYLTVVNGAVTGYAFDVIDGGGGVPKIASPVQVVNGVVTDLTQYIAAMTTEAHFMFFDYKNFGPM